MYRRLIVLGLVLAGWQTGTAAPPLPARPYHPQDFRLAYETFVQTGALEDALAVALKAVEAVPEDRRWRQALARVALWLGRSHLALEQYVTLTCQGAPGHFTTAEKLATAIQAYDQLVRLYRCHLRQAPDDTDTLLKLVTALVGLGDPELAVEQLWRRYRRRPQSTLLKRLAFLYREMDLPSQERRVLTLQIERFGPTEWAVSQLATLLFLQGELSHAYRLLKTHFFRLKRPEKTLLVLFLDLAWRHQDYATFYRIVRRHPASLPPQAIPRLIHLHRGRGDLQAAFETALRLWQRSPDRTSALLLLAIASADPTGKLRDRVIPLLQRTLPPGLRHHPRYLIELSHWYRQHGRIRLARQILRQALRRHPEQLDLVLEYLWLAVDSGQAGSVEPWLTVLLPYAQKAPRLRDPLVAVLSALDRPLEALVYARMQLRDRQTDPLWLLNYADLLDQAERPTEARWWRLRAWKLWRRQGGRSRNDDRMLRLLLAIDAGDSLAFRLLHRIHQVEKAPLSDAAFDALLVWGIAQGDALRRYVVFQARRRHRLPRWAALSHALSEADGDRLMQLLTDNPDALPRRDLVSAARRLRYDAWGLDQAFLRLDRLPDDWRLARQYRGLVVDQADGLGCLWRYDNLQDAHWQRLRCRLDESLLPRLRLRFHSDHLLAIDTDPTAWTGTVPKAGDDRIELRYTNRWGETRLTGGVRHALGEHWIAGIHHRHPVTSRLTVSARFIRGNTSTESLPLFLAGSSRDLLASLDFRIDSRQHVHLEAGYRWFHDAHGQRLGQGWGVDADYRYLWHGQNPQASLTTTFLWRDYTESAHIPARLRRHLPADAVNPGRFIVPRAYWQAGLTLDLDTVFTTGIPSRLRPYLRTSATWHSINGFGGGIDIGLATQILGPDRLTLGFEVIRGAQGLQNDFTGLRLGYRLYF